ncbi:MAG: phenylacetate--CoA ligase family protein [Bdellovibrionales bacterium]|nr:phenylacetate--CoA ligase family protein [Bdellovibrionales bacterium]
MNTKLANLVYHLAATVRREATFRYLSDYEASQWWDREQIEVFQSDRLAELLNFIADEVPKYNGVPADSVYDLPIVSKKEIKEQTKLFLAQNPNGPLTTKTTGGSTGQPITIVKSSDAMAREQAGTLRGYSWAGIYPGNKQARMWGVPRNSAKRNKESIRDFLLNRIRFSAFNYKESDLAEFYQRFMNFRPDYIYGYVSMVRDFANFLSRNGKMQTYPWLKAVVTTSEVLSEAARQDISKAFGVRVYNEYGCGEVGTIAHECEHGTMHVSSENLFIEILDEQNKPTKQDGKIIVTELHNRAQPLVRYELGDYGRLGRGDCPCGRKLTVLENIHGRAYDIVVGPEGRKYHPEFFIYIFEELKQESESILQFQLVQNNETLNISLVRGKDFDQQIETQILARLRQEFGDYFTTDFNYVDSIPREPSGKLRVVKRAQPVELPN